MFEKISKRIQNRFVDKLIGEAVDNWR